MTIRKASENSVADGCRGTLLTYSTTLDGNGAQADIIFTITQQIEVIELYGIVTEATDATTCTGASFTFFGPVAAPDVTESAVGTDLSSIRVGAIFGRFADASTALSVGNTNQCRVIEGASDILNYNCLLARNLTSDTYVVFNFTGDAATDIDVTFYLRYRLISGVTAGGGVGGGGGGGP